MALATALSQSKSPTSKGKGKRIKGVGWNLLLGDKLRVGDMCQSLESKARLMYMLPQYVGYGSESQ